MKRALTLLAILWLLSLGVVLAIGVSSNLERSAACERKGGVFARPWGSLEYTCVRPARQ